MSNPFTIELMQGRVPGGQTLALWHAGEEYAWVLTGQVEERQGMFAADALCMLTAWAHMPRSMARMEDVPEDWGVVAGMRASGAVDLTYCDYAKPSRSEAARIYTGEICPW